LSDAGDNPAGSPPTQEALAANAQPPAEAEPAAGEQPAPLPGDVAYCWSILPDGLIYHSYLAGPKEPRFASAWLEDKHLGSMWDIALGFRQSILRYGAIGPERPEGFEVDIDGAVFPRILPWEAYDLMSADFRFGIPITYGGQRVQTKLEFYHISSHVGDEYIFAHPGTQTDDYTWDGIGWGLSWYVNENLRLYEEIEYGYGTGGPAKPLEFQFGIDFSPVWTFGSRRGAPFLAMNAHLYQMLNYSGSFVLQTGWQWRGTTGNTLRLGLEYFTGFSDQYEFYNQREDKIGLGVWYDF
jgi:hypothetical protein